MIFETMRLDLVGKLQPNTSTISFSSNISSAYCTAISNGLDSMTGGGKCLTALPRQGQLQSAIQLISEMNLKSHNQVNVLNQYKIAFDTFWLGQVITGSLGIATITTSTWNGLPLVPNYDSNIFISTFVTCAKLHLMGLLGTFVPLTGTPISYSGVTFIIP